MRHMQVQRFVFSEGVDDRPGLSSDTDAVRNRIETTFAE
jgi:hypothetical protein